MLIKEKLNIKWEAINELIEEFLNNVYSENVQSKLDETTKINWLMNLKEERWHQNVNDGCKKVDEEKIINLNSNKKEINSHDQLKTSPGIRYGFVPKYKQPQKFAKQGAWP